MSERKVFYSAADHGGCAYYRMYLPFAYVKKEEGWNCMYSYNTNPVSDDEVIKKILDTNTDLVILQRKWDRKLLKVIDAVREKGVRVAYELDDNIWDMPFYNPNAKEWTEDRIVQAEEIMNACDAIITSTVKLKSQIETKLVGVPVYVIPNYVEKVIFKKPDYRIDKLRVGWAGGDNHIVDFTAQVNASLRKVKEKNDIDLVCFGFIPKTLIGYARKVEPVDCDKYLPMLNYLNFDIGFIPCSKIRFNLCRSNVKFLEYSMVGIPTVASDVIPYRDVYEYDHEMISLVEDPEEWTEKIEELIKDERRRQKMVGKAQKFVAENYLIEDKINTILETYEEILQ